MSQEFTKEEDQKQTIANFCLMDDTFLSTVFQDNIPATEKLLHILLNNDKLSVERVDVQYAIKSLSEHSAYLDIYAKDENGKHYNIEVQNKNDGATPKRARFYSALLDTKITTKRMPYDDIPETYVIFITRHDILNENKPIYFIDRHINDSQKPFNDGSHIIYVNSEIQDDTALGHLMSDFYKKDASEMHYQFLAKRVDYFKNDTEGFKEMCELMEKYTANRIKEATEKVDFERKKKIALKLLARGNTLEDTAELTELPLETVLELANKKSA